MNSRYISIKPAIRKRAEVIATARPTTFKNWQAVIRLAIDYGLSDIQVPPHQPSSPSGEYVPIRKFIHANRYNR